MLEKLIQDITSAILQNKGITSQQEIYKKDFLQRIKEYSLSFIVLLDIVQFGAVIMRSNTR